MTTATDEATEPETGDEPDNSEEPETPEEPESPDETDFEDTAESDDTPKPAAVTHSEDWWEKAWKASEKENQRHASRIEQIFEEESLEFSECPMCLNGPSGWLVTPNFSEEHAALIKLALGLEDPSEYEAMDGAAKCDKCKGKGKVRTPSLVEAEQIKPCMACNGLGWNYVQGPGTPPPQTFGLPPSPATDSVALEQPQGPDAWSRPVGHPHYGRPPADVY